MPKRARAPIETLLEQDGEQRIALLRYCVMSVTMEPMFVFLANEYKLRPSHLGALALYDVFCSPDAPARINARAVLPPLNLRLASTIGSMRVQWQQVQPLAPEQYAGRAPRVAPARSVFDLVVESLAKDPKGRIARLRRRYDPSRSPVENLRGGKMTPGQRAFVERIWKPVARPRLVAAGFWRIATIE
jgi:hypothetical protein